MNLAALAREAGLALDDAACPPEWLTAPVTGFAIDHRKVAPGNVFGAFAGARVNGEDYIAAAVAAGAIAVVTRSPALVAGAVPIIDANPRRAFARLAARFYQPSPAHIVAVTGTNGKTSTVEMTRQLWRMAGLRAASIGTLGVTTPDDTVTTGLTTPDIVTFLANMTGLAREGVSHIAYEASSHGLDQHRNDGLAVEAAAFTNLSRDHLDYHGDMEAYFAAKMRLFDEVLAPGGTAVVWMDDAGDGAGISPWAARVAARAQARGLRVLTVGVAGTAIRLVARSPSQLGQVLTLALAPELGGGEHTLTLPLIGAYQAANALTAAALALATGVAWPQLRDGLARLRPVRGRLERAALTRAGAPVYIDYAHTPEALAAAIAALRPHFGVQAGQRGKLIVVFGAGGDRDTGKRAPMGGVVAREADIAIVTDDNPRGEDPATIRAAILAGIQAEMRESTDQPCLIHEIGDRRAAIAAGIHATGPRDIVLVAGKGHEQGQIVGAGEACRILPFDDVAIAHALCAEEP